MSKGQLIELCKISDLQDPGSMGFDIEVNGREVNLFVVHKYGEFFAYINSCPHRRSPLEWQEHEFLDTDKDFIQCSTHDALFEIPTGLCIKGPCVGESLSPIRIEQQADSLHVRLG